MIQRIQSIYLLLAAICMLLMFIAPIETLHAIPANLEVKGYNLQWFIQALIVFTAAILVLTIFQFKNRNIQKRFCFGAIILVGITFLAAFFGAAASPTIPAPRTAIFICKASDQAGDTNGRVPMAAVYRIYAYCFHATVMYEQVTSHG